ncbi:MAG: ABC transporter substrate-binding protein [Hyphomicrobiales bacterium]|nr:ABC transporter substrate-binding protein [Hyphomicrobiales bacterium]
MTSRNKARRGISRRETLKGLSVLGGASLASALGGQALISAARAQDGMAAISMQLGWLASNGILGEVVAKRKGFYEEEGVALEITPGGPGVDGVASVAAGAAQVGQLSSSPSLMLARSAGIPIKAFAAGYQKHPFTYFSLESDPIRVPDDMIGKTIATQPTAMILLRALLAKNGIPEDEVNAVNMGSDMNQLLTGQAQAVTGWLTNTNALAILGPERVDMMLWDTGIQLYANVYYATDEMLGEQADALTSFLTGSARGWGYAKDNPEEAVDLLVAEYPNLDKASEMEAVGPVLGFSFDDTTKSEGWAAMNRENWAAQIETYASLDQFEGETPTIDDVMTLDILNATADIRKKVG